MNVDAARVFRVGPCVGRGGFGEVYRATVRSSGGLESEVALKVLRADPSGGDAIARFRDEGRMLARLQHPNVVKAFDWARLEGTTALVTEYVEGVDLAEVAGTIPVRPALEAVAAIGSALEAAWSTPGPDGRPLRIVHRDLKPSNIRVGRHGQAKLLDFGIATLGSSDRESRTRSALIVGSLPYMAPERFTERDSLPSIDVYGLGCVLFEILVGEPFHREARLRELSLLALDPERSALHLADRLATLPPSVPAEVVDLVRRCLALAPESRPTPAELAVEALRLAPAAPGPTLRRWAAETPVPPAAAAPGPFTGRTLVDGAPAPAVEADPSRPSRESAPRDTWSPDEPAPVRRASEVIPHVVTERSGASPWWWAGGGCLVASVLVGVVAVWLLFVLSAVVGVWAAS